MLIVVSGKIPKLRISVCLWELTLSRKDFDKLLLEAVDEGLSSMGESSKQAIYFHLEKSFNIKRQEIPCKIKVFEHSVEKIFGLGADFLEVLIMKRIHEKTEGHLKWHRSQDFTFTEYVAAARRSFLAKKETKKTTEEIVQCDQMMIKR